jgi:hypothetical protein
VLEKLGGVRGPQQGISAFEHAPRVAMVLSDQSRIALFHHG